MLKNKKFFLLDMDGTIYLGDQLFDSTTRFLNKIKEKGGKYLFLTNNSSKSTEAYVNKLSSLGIQSSPDDFLTSTHATCLYINEHYLGKKFYAFGTASFIEQLVKSGITVTTEPEDDVFGIVMGNDTELTFKKLEDVCKMLLSRDIPYIATNPDYVCPTEFGSVPDCGSVCDMIYNATKKRPFVIGKPKPEMPLIAMKKWGVSKEKTAVIGDRIYTDVKSGLAAGAVSVLVLSGETDEGILNSSDVKPDIVLESAREIIDLL